MNDTARKMVEQAETDVVREAGAIVAHAKAQERIAELKKRITELDAKIEALETERTEVESDLNSDLDTVTRARATREIAQRRLDQDRVAGKPGLPDAVQAAKTEVKRLETALNIGYSQRQTLTGRLVDRRLERKKLAHEMRELSVLLESPPLSALPIVWAVMGK